MEKQKITEEFLYMQKLAGILTEEEYTHQSKELKLKNLSEKISEKINIIKQHLKDQGYDV